MKIPSIADRVWYAYHCLPRDKATGELPSYRELEMAYDLSMGTLSKTILGTRTKHWPVTFPRLAEALGCTVKFLTTGEGRAPRPRPGASIPPRPGTGWKRHRDVPGWTQAVTEALKRSDLPIPPAAFRDGADLPVYRHVATMTADLAIFVSGYAYATANPVRQARRATRKPAKRSPEETQP